jgi:hypothetical protein
LTCSSKDPQTSNCSAETSVIETEKLPRRSPNKADPEGQELKESDSVDKGDAFLGWRFWIIFLSLTVTSLLTASELFQLVIKLIR